MELQGNKYILSTGKVLDPYGGFIGLSEVNNFEVSEGFDSTFTLEKDILNNEEFLSMDDVDFTNQELKEIANYMSELWKRFADSIQ